MVQPRGQETLHSENRVRQLASDCSQQLKAQSPFKAEKKCCFCLFLLGSYYPRGFPPDPRPQSPAPSSEFQVIYCQCPKASRSGAKDGVSPLQNPSLVAPKSGGVSACLSLGGDSGEAEKIWAPARSLVKKQTVFTFSKSNIPA